MNQIENKIIQFLDKKNKIVFDVGCFKGNFTKNLIKCDRKEGIKSNFYLFDPNPNAEKYISELRNDNQIKYFNLAIDNTNSRKIFYLNNFFEPSGSGLSKVILGDKKCGFTRKLFMKIFQPFKKIKDIIEINVETKTLDLFCDENKVNNIDLLKIDAEGNEKNILLGSQKLLSENRIHSIYVEIADTKDNFNDKTDFIIKHLQQFGFELKISLPIRSFSFLSNLRATDNLFVNKNYKLPS